MNDSNKKIQEKINSIEGLPGSSFNKEAAWQKLQLRMDKKTAGRSRLAYYSMAAAIIAALICITVLIPRRSKDVVSSAPKPVIQDSVTKAGLPPPVIVVKSAPKTKTKHKTSASPENKPPQIAPVQQVTQRVATVPEEIIPPQPIIAKATVEPKKVKVIHISDVAEEIPPYQPAPHSSFITSAQYKYKNTIARPAAQNTVASTGWFR